jgi:cob(I)alamin adenosyltransferase
LKIYTKTGDQGETSLYSGERVAKTDRRISAVGTMDELNAGLGLAIANGPEEDVRLILVDLQNLVFRIAADLATVGEKRTLKRLAGEDIQRMEGVIDQLSARLPEIRAFILPGGTPAAAQIHVCRTVCRRAEREAIALAAEHPLNPHVGILLNRLSDLLFLLARLQNHLCETEDATWQPASR